ncbi:MULTISPECIES: solute carrier family 23 protein [Bradyrhizobium]|uniref:solute carrier family 23 protein n=1 Tax=Bradyrhizobium TaxID=374 RepID=UPI001EDACFEA|nr:solute carrier family 23 protein [Bradyrhizobium zhengyangense]MCG2641014.1 pyrimidine utilization transport protein G [Bradyrhizobium zhengyangense]
MSNARGADEPSQGYFPRWKLKTSGVIMPEERLPWGQTIVSGLQHCVAMSGSTIIAPLLMGFDPNVAVLFSGIGTLIFLVIVAGRVPSYLGSSFAFIAVVLAATGYAGHGPNPNISVALGGIVGAGVLYGVIALIVMWSGISWVERLMPPAVTGAVVAAIGLNLAPVAVKAVSANAFETWIGLATVLMIGVVAVVAPGLWRRLPIILGAIGGYLLYLLFANGLGFGKPIDFAQLSAAPWVGLPNFTTPTFQADAIFLIAPVAVILVAENLGHIKAVGAMTGRSLDAYLGRALLADSLATILAACGGGTGVTTYAENIGVMAATKVYSTLLFAFANLITVAVALTAGAGDLTLKFGAFTIGGIGTATFGAIILYQILTSPIARHAE